MPSRSNLWSRSKCRKPRFSPSGLPLAVRHDGRLWVTGNFRGIQWEPLHQGEAWVRQKPANPDTEAGYAHCGGR